MASEKHLPKVRGWRPLLLLGVALAAAFLLAGTLAQAEPLRVHGAVFAWAQENPGEPVPVIIQHDGDSGAVADLVRRNGGSVEREFHIIPALDAEIPASAIDDLGAGEHVAWVSLDAPVQSTTSSVTASAVAQAYPFAVGANNAWEQGYLGTGVTVAVLDTGVSDDAKEDFYNDSGGLRVQWVSPNPALDVDEDGFGHGTHVAGIIAGHSTKTDPVGKYTGVAPRASVLSVRVATDDGSATIGDVMAGLEWVDDNRSTYNIRVLNLSLTSSVAQSYLVDPLDAAVELLWFHDVTVVVSAGNLGSASDAVYYPPANDPFVIVVGAFDDVGTKGKGDDVLTSWSSRGLTQDGYAKPDVVAPGRNIISPVSPASYLAQTYPERIVERYNQAYFRMSGTSMAAAVTSGVVALALHAHPEWTPGQVKFVLMNTARSVTGDTISRGGVLADSAVNFQGTPGNTNDGLTPNFLLLAAAGVPESDLDALQAEIVSALGSPDFNGIRWDGIRWAGIRWGGIRWADIAWGGIRWSGIRWSGIRWGGVDFDGIRWAGIRWGAVVGD
jgi:serine protease AprX